MSAAPPPTEPSRLDELSCLGGFFEAWGDRLYRLSLFLTGDPATAEDVVQEAATAAAGAALGLRRGARRAPGGAGMTCEDLVLDSTQRTILLSRAAGRPNGGGVGHHPGRGYGRALGPLLDSVDSDYEGRVALGDGREHARQPSVLVYTHTPLEPVTQSPSIARQRQANRRDSMVKQIVAALALLTSQAACATSAKPFLCPRHPNDSTILNPTWDSLDANGLPLNPRWKIQEAQGSSPCLVDPMREDTCGGFPTKKGVPNVDRCTDFAVLDEPSGFNYAVCNRGLVPNSERFGGHINWMPVTYTGLIFYRTHVPPDDDYNFELLPVSVTHGGQ